MTPNATQDPPAAGTRSAQAVPPPPRRSIWTPKQKLVRAVWGTAGRLFWELLPPARSALLRLFGGRVGRGCSFGSGIDIAIPWNIRCGDRVQVADRVILYGLGPITIGDGTVIDYRAHICAGTHDMTDSRFPLLKPPITIGRGCFIGLDAYLGPGIELGDRCRVLPRASVYKSAPPDTWLRGNPARPFDPAAEGDAP
ncbi:MAG: hypothetical protein DYG93_09155 [Leptolyngbya sp. PLA2]|nr:hypothetical protein [Leptolyngbya sp.]MCE7971814.1 hypothetical protein [Leptolyngbya sp. PL-A2]MCZ7634456.1 hypothetical protein [Phycisphaerales bacterium]MDL1904747.1 hypothetical protein [Synechococcales cyanobacterium CNB]GIK19771.1 MAG: hypothetical protein BroJett004_19350 [Planctomycetota bacterium]